jgi:hypothetical protein
MCVTQKYSFYSYNIIVTTLQQHYRMVPKKVFETLKKSQVKGVLGSCRNCAKVTIAQVQLFVEAY